ncbi:MAG: primosomal protein N' [Planctomycetota bacterium]
MTGLFGQPDPQYIGKRSAAAVETGPPRDDVVQVAVERGVDLVDGLSYLEPPGQRLAVGVRVQVPLGRKDKPTRGVVVARGCEGPAPKRLKAVLRVEPGPGLPEELVELGRWLARYYACPLGVAISAMLPAAVKQGTGGTLRRWVRLAAAREADDSGSLPRRSAQQQKLIEAAGSGDWVELAVLLDRAGVKTAGPAQKLIDNGVLQAEDRPTVRSRLVTDAAAQAERQPAIPVDKLTPGQRQAIERMTGDDAQGFGVHLLHGVTGSGKTEVYLRLIEHALSCRADGGSSDGRLDGAEHPSGGALVLVPEIALTPQTVARFVGRFDRVAVLHSGLSAAQRHAEWRRIHAGEVEIVIGARSAVFAPLPDLRLIVVDEEHDGSYKQDQAPRYHGRDVAIRRAQRLGVPIVLGSATPSLESWARSQTDRSTLHTLPERPSGWKLPKVELVDLAQERRERRGVHMVSRRLERRLREAFAADKQAVLLLNRRGFASYLACPSHACGWQLRCDHCDAAMVFHRDRKVPSGGTARCHHCDARRLVPALCPLCSRRPVLLGEGVQRVEQELETKFPGVATLRMDADTMRRAEDYRRTLDAFGRGEARILLGTQMIAKGLDYPGVSVVGVISADTALQVPDFRSAERTFQLIAQVVGRAGRGHTAGVAVVQTYHPQDPTVGLAAAQDYPAFAERELVSRRRAGLPPAGRMARVVCRHVDEDKASAMAADIAEVCRAVDAQRGLSVEVAGPAPCVLGRVSDHFRFEVRLLAAGGPEAAARLQALLADLRGRVKLVSDAGTAIDVDPVSLM